VTYNPDPSTLAADLADMQAYWREAEIDALYGLSLAESRRAKPMPAKIRRRADIVISRNLDRTSSRTLAVREWRAHGFGPQDAVAEILLRVANTEASWRTMLAIVRAAPVIPDAPPRHAIGSPGDLAGWLLRLEEWARPEKEIIDDLKATIAARTPRADEALDHVHWTAEDDLEAIAAVLARSEEWDIDDGTRKHLMKASEAARKELTALIALVEQARPFSILMQSAALFAEVAKSEGRKPN
jgi:hypothetical protein